MPDEVYELFRLAMDRGREARASWESRRDALFAAEPEVAGRWASHFSPPDVQLDGPSFDVGTSMATRKASAAVIDHVAALRPDLMGGSGDLTPSTNTFIEIQEAIIRRGR